MKQTRKMTIANRVFSLADLKRISEVFERQRLLARKSEHHSSTKYEVEFSDSTSIQGESNEVINEDVLARVGRPVSIQYWYHNYALDRDLGFSIRHGDSPYGNQTSVSADDSSWVDENFTKLKDAIDTARPQDHWCRRHKTILLILIATGVGWVVTIVSGEILNLLIRLLNIANILTGITVPKDSPWREVLPRLAVVLFIFRWVVIAPALGFMFGAFSIRSWLLQLWPMIELDIGCEHLKMEKRRRQRLFTVLSLIVVPTVLGIALDLIRLIF